MGKDGGGSGWECNRSMWFHNCRKKKEPKECLVEWFGLSSYGEERGCAKGCGGSKDEKMKERSGEIYKKKM